MGRIVWIEQLIADGVVADERLAHVVDRIRLLVRTHVRGEPPSAVGGAGGSPAEEGLESALMELAGLLADDNRRQAARIHEQDRELERERKVLADAVAQVERTQNQLLQSEKMAAVGQLAAGVAHEINNPVGFVSSNLGSLGTYLDRLFAVIGAYERLEHELSSDHPARVAVAQARKAAEFDYLREDIPDLLRESVEGLSRVKHIVNDLKDFSRADEGEWQDADLNRGLESTLNVVWNELKYKAQVVREFAELPPVRCIPAQINQVFMNLLVNAAQAIETSGTINLRSGTTDEHAWVEVSDTGKGMPAEVRQRIFEPFFTTKPIGTGTGLGLSISADIMRRHNGGIEVQSEPGQGTTFRILLPLAARNPDAPPAAA